VGVFGEFTVSDYQVFEREVLATLRLTGQVDLLVDLRDMLKYTLDVAWEDIRFVRAHAHDFRRVAVIARDEFTVWLGWLTRLLTNADVRVFDDEDSARDWATEGASITSVSTTMNYTTLISVADLARQLGDPGLVVFDCRHDLVNKTIGGESYAKSHLPGAHFSPGRSPAATDAIRCPTAMRSSRGWGAWALPASHRWWATTAAAACTARACGGCSSTGSVTRRSPCSTAAGTPG
jgi:hypothetical protein